MMDEEPRDEDEAELVRPKASTRTLVLAVLAGALATLILAAAAWYAQQRDADEAGGEPASSASDGTSDEAPGDEAP